MICEDARDRGPVGEVADLERRLDRGGVPGREVVENDDGDAQPLEEPHGMAADVPGAATDENGALGHDRIGVGGRHGGAE